MGSGRRWAWALGCGVVAVLGISLCVGSSLWLLPRVTRGVRNAVVEETRRTAFASLWRPPADDVTAEELFPASVAGFQLAGHDEQAEVARFQIDVEGRHAVYRSSKVDVEVYVYRASSLEKEAIYRRVLRSLGALRDQDDPFADKPKNPYDFQSSIGTPTTERLRFTARPPFHRGRLWWSQDWLFFFLTKKEIELDTFQQKYLRAVQGSGAVSTELPATASPAGTKPR